MGIVGSALESRALKISAGALKNPPVWLREFFGGMGGATASGVRVDEESAMRFIAVTACVTLLADVIASLTFPVYERLQPRGRERAVNHPLYEILHDRPNPEMTSFERRHMEQMHRGLWGASYAEIEYNNGGRAMALWPIPPRRIKPERNKDSGKLVWKVSQPAGGPDEELGFNQVLYIPWASLDGVTPLSPIGLAREAVGLGLAAQEYAARFFANDATPGFAVQLPGVLSDAAYKRMQASWETRHQGLGNKHRMALLEEGANIVKTGMPPKDAEFLANHKQQKADVAMLYRIPAHMIGDTERSTSWGTGMEEQTLGFTVFTVRPWTVREEQKTNMMLIPREERRRYYAEVQLDSLLRGDIEKRWKSYLTGWQMGVYSPNMIGDKENLNPIPDGDTHYVPLNYIPTDQAAQARAAHSPGEQRSAGARRRIAGSYRRVFRAAAEELVDGEIEDIRGILAANDDGRAGRAGLKPAPAGIRDVLAAPLLQAIEDYYDSREEGVLKRMAPAFSAYGEAVYAAAADEVGGEPEMGPETERFIAGVAGGYAARHIGSSRGQLREVVRKALSEGADIGEAVGARLDEWGEKRPEKIAKNETVRAGNAVAKEAWRVAGVRQVAWKAFGKNCPYCTAMDGRIVGIDQVFLEPGDFQPDGATVAMPVKSAIGHPPAHGSCDCAVDPA